MTNGHPFEDADYDLYALGALRGEENAAIESHAASCQECAQKLAQARGRIALLALAVDPVQPSPGVKESLMRQLMASAEGHETWQRPEEPSRVRYRATRWWSAIWAPADVAQLQSQVQDTEANVALFSAKDTVRVALAPSKDFRGASASVRYNSRL